jgi:hypothetical protein
MLTAEEKKNLDRFMMFLDIKRSEAEGSDRKRTRFYLSSGTTRGLVAYRNKIEYGLFLMVGEYLTDKVPDLSYKEIIYTNPNEPIKNRKEKRDEINKTKVPKVWGTVASESAGSKAVPESEVSVTRVEG